MQMLFLPKPFRQCVRVDESRLSERARARLAHLKAVWGMVEGGCPVDVAIAGRGVSRRTFFRWQGAFRRRGPRGLSRGAPVPPGGGVRSGGRGRSGPSSPCGSASRSWAPAPCV